MTHDELVESMVRDVTQGMSRKFQSCAEDDEFLKNGVRLVTDAYEKAHPEDVDEVDMNALIRLTLKISFAQAAKFADEFPKVVKITIVTKDKEPPHG